MFRLIFQLVVCISMSFAAFGGVALANPLTERYWLLDEFKNAYPQQKQLMESFSEQVAQSPTPIQQSFSQPVKVAVIYPGNQISDYWRRSDAAFEARLAELKIPAEVSGYFSRPGIEKRLQEEQIAEALATDPDYLVFTLDVARHKRIIEQVIARGRPKLILQNITTPVKAWGEHQPFLYVGFDHVEGAKLLAQALLAQPRPPKRVAVLYRNPGYVSTMRGDTFIDEVSRAGVEVKSRFFTKADRASARLATRAALEQDPDLDFIYASATDLAVGAWDELRAQSRLNVGVNGWGGGARELFMLERGMLQFTAMRINDDAGVAMAEAIKRDLQGKAVPLIYAGRIVLVDGQTSREMLEQYRNQAFRYSGLMD